MDNLVILGCGYTGRRVARLMIAAGNRVICTSRDPSQLAHLTELETMALQLPLQRTLDFITPGSRILYSIPPVEGYDNAPFWRALRDRKPSRVVYLSTTGVYGDQLEVDETTPASPRDDHDGQRLTEESAVLSGGNWSGIVLRPAAIYGPGRGIHESMRKGTFKLVGKGDNFVSRIHVDDLTAHVEAALFSNLVGAWPVADEEPCTSREISEFCSELLGVPMPEELTADAVHRTRRANRRVNGRAIRTALKVQLKYLSYRQGIPASL